MDVFYSFYEQAEYGVEDDLRYLKLFSEYDNVVRDNSHCPVFLFDIDSPGIQKIKKIWDIDNVAGDGTELQKIGRLKKWANQLLCFKGLKLESRRYDKLDCFDTISLAKKEGYSLNCRYISLIFTQILLAAGFKARWVSCLPMELNYNECHCVTEVYINELKKWIVVDVAFNLLYFDKMGNLLNLYELRQHILTETKFRVFSLTPEHFQYVWEYWTRHVFRFKFLLENTYSMLLNANKTFVFLNPKNFIVNNKRIISNNQEITNFLQFYNSEFFWKEIA